MDINYCITAEMVLNPDQWAHYSQIFRETGITRLWLNGYFFGHWESPISDLKAAREVIVRDNFSVGVINLAVGHPGNSLDPSNPDVIVKIPETWQYRIDMYGNPVNYCGDINDQLIEDNKNAVIQLQQAGFSTICLDDDLRMGNWGPKLAGCFCESCLQKFNTQFNYSETRENLRSCIEKHQNPQVLRDWTAFTCQKVTRLMKAVALPGIQLQIMIMHYGDERHGIDVAAIKSAVPNCWFRVGESHFSDRDFNPSLGKAKEMTGIQSHLLRIGSNRSFSETTEFPHGFLSPLNWAYKAKMAVVAGVDEIFLMGTYKKVDEIYMAAIKDARAQIEILQKLRNHQGPTYPIHFASGSKNEFESPFILPLQGVLGGLPACPVRSDDEVHIGKDHWLVIFGKIHLNDQWQEKLSKYTHILIDSVAWKLNHLVLGPYRQKIIRIPSLAGLALRKELKNLPYLRKILKKNGVSFPFLTNGEDIGLVWYQASDSVNAGDYVKARESAKARDSVIVFNLRNHPHRGKLQWGIFNQDLSLNPLEFRVLTKME